MAAHFYFVPYTPPETVLYFKNITLDYMNKETQEESDFNNADYVAGTHKMGRFIKHAAIVIGIKERKIIEYAWIYSRMN